MIAVARSAAWFAFLAVALLQVHHLTLPLAPGWSSAGASGAEGAAALVMGLARVAAMGLGWYLLGATILMWVAGAAGAAGRLAERLAGRVIPGTVQELVRGACGLTLILATTTPTLAAAEERAPITMHRLPGARESAAEPAITMRRLDPVPTIDPASDATSGTPMPASPRSDPSTHVIGPGEHLWSVAESTLAIAWGAQPHDAEVDPYWRELIRRNRLTLPDPANPDLVHPGTELELPPVPVRDV